jgi:enamine deaminase RidA (YjgF/YER057c/UK114 family)
VWKAELIMEVVKTNTFVTDYQAFTQCSDVRMRYFGVASSTMLARSR